MLLWGRHRKDYHNKTGYEEERWRVLKDGLIQESTPGRERLHCKMCVLTAGEQVSFIQRVFRRRQSS